MNIIGWIIIGALAGALANYLMHEKGGLLKNMIIGIVGAFLGGFLVNILGGQGITGFNIWSFLVALAGSVLLIVIGRALFGKKKK